MVVREMQLNPTLGVDRRSDSSTTTRASAGWDCSACSVLGTTAEIGRSCSTKHDAGRGRDRDPVGARRAAGEGRCARVASAAIPVRTLPTVFELLRGGVQLTRQLREVQVEDVLGRDPVRKELDRVGAYLEDRVVMVTGAGGSIGSELSRQIARVRPRLLVLLDHAEDNLFEIEREMTEQQHFSRCEVGPRRLQGGRPDAARSCSASARRSSSTPPPTSTSALMEANPLEAIRNNAIGDQGHGRDGRGGRASTRFVLVSTDKAVNPQTVMGASKAMAEWIVAARRPAPRDDAVRRACGSATCSAPPAASCRSSAADRAGRPGDRHPPGHDALLHDDPGGGAARDHAPGTSGPRRARCSCSRWASRSGSSTSRAT